MEFKGRGKEGSSAELRLGRRSKKDIFVGTEGVSRVIRGADAGWRRSVEIVQLKFCVFTVGTRGLSNGS